VKIPYQETTNDLMTRINIHNQFGGRDIDEWMLQVLALQEGIKILDIGCGAGKQCFSFYNYLKGNCDITGGDINQALLEQARKDKAGKRIQFLDNLDFNKPLPFQQDTFDLVSCCFAIYYAEDIPFTIREMHRILKPGGRLFTTGPMPNNKQLFYDIIKTSTQKPIPPMPGSSRYSTLILDAIRKTFTNVNVKIFENPLTFQSVEPFITYTRASLSEDRKLWTGLFDNKDDFEQLMAKITVEATRRLQQENGLVMTKVVGGFIATK